MMGSRILVVDDEEHIVHLARLYLESDGYCVLSAGDGSAALERVRNDHPTLLVLDIMLPEMDGFEVCRHLRSEGNPIPILMVTARDEDIDKILGLELGADDYLTKPFNPRELVARVKAILRRTENPTPSSEKPVYLPDLEINPARHEVLCQGSLVDLRAQEFEVLLVLAQHKGQVLTREQLLQLAWGFDFAGETRTVDVHIAQLRRKLTASRVRIETVTGIGYKLEA
jgi:two-component system, OmpR family, alkaline phosphatase synthesis response regulator PhoP